MVEFSQLFENGRLNQSTDWKTKSDLGICYSGNKDNTIYWAILEGVERGCNIGKARSLAKGGSSRPPLSAR